MTIHSAIGATASTALAAAGASPSTGPRQLLFFGATNVAAGDNATPASSTPVAAQFCGATGITAGFTAIRPGHITGMSITLSVAAAGSAAIFGVYKGSTLVASLTIGTSGTANFAAYSDTAYAFAANDTLIVKIRTGSGWSATTSDAAIAVEITPST